jgi:nucleolar protein 58
MLILVETAGGLGLFKVSDKKILEAEPDDVFANFQTPDAAAKAVSLTAFAQFKDNKQAMTTATSIIESKVDKTLNKFLKKNIVDKGLKDKLLVVEKDLGRAINEKLGISFEIHKNTQAIYRGIKEQLTSLVEGLDDKDEAQMALGLSHALNRFKLKFSPDKVDTMIIQAVGLLDDLDKELNNFAMRLREWYGWHFPELAKVVTDNLAFAKTVRVLGMRSNAKNNVECDLPEETMDEVKKAAEISMGVEITEQDLGHIRELCDRVIELTEYRLSLQGYLKNRMTALAPNLTHMVGELIGARLISHAGSVLSLAKHPASTIQILGAEKALFRALKTKSATPKYGLLFHASLVGQSSPKMKGKIARVLAAKLALAVRVDALGGEETTAEIGVENREYVEKRMRQLEAGETGKVTKSLKSDGPSKYSKSATTTYNDEADAPPKKKRKASADAEELEEAAPKKKKKKKVEEEEEEEEEEEVPKKKKKKKAAEE